jgi:hypothetical protein
MEALLILTILLGIILPIIQLVINTSKSRKTTNEYLEEYFLDNLILGQKGRSNLI